MAKNLRSGPSVALETQILEIVQRKGKKSVEAEAEEFVDPEEERDEKIMLIFEGFDIANLERNDWKELKANRKFWKDIIVAFDFVDHEKAVLKSVTYDDGREEKIMIPTFDISDISKIVGSAMTYKIIGHIDLFGLPQLELVKQAKKDFFEYMMNYDENACAHFLVIYARYLALTKKLVSYDTFMTHKPKTVVNALNIVKEKEYLFTSSLVWKKGKTTFVYHFSMKKPVTETEEERRVREYLRQSKKEEVVYTFEIKHEQNVKTITTQGPIEKILKFPYDNYLFVVISGPLDSILLKMKHNNIAGVCVPVPKFQMNFDFFRDVTFVDDDVNSKFCTSSKSSKSIDSLLILNLAMFIGMHVQKVIPVVQMTSEEKKLMLEQRATVRNGGTVDELVQIRSAYDYKNLYDKIVPPLDIKFKDPSLFPPRTTEFVKDDILLLSACIVPIPGATNLNIFHLATLSRHYVLIKEKLTYYIELLLFKYEYKVQTERFEASGGEVTYNLGSFLNKDSEFIAYTVEDMKLVFHSPTHFYVEVIQKENVTLQSIVSEGDRLITVSSAWQEFLLSEDFGRVGKRPPVTQAVIKPLITDFTLFELARANGYMVHDFRHSLTEVSALNRYDCILYKYDYVKQKSRLIFYKRHLTGPSVAELSVETDKYLKPGELVGVSPTHDSGGLCNITSKRNGKSDVILRITTGSGYRDYDEKSFGLSALSLDCRCPNPEKTCIFCGDPSTFTDVDNGQKYCTDMCQYLYCETSVLRV